MNNFCENLFQNFYFITLQHRKLNSETVSALLVIIVIKIHSNESKVKLSDHLVLEDSQEMANLKNKRFKFYHLAKYN